MTDTYTLNLCGLTRELKKVQVAPNLKIASFVMLGDTMLIEKTADALYEKLKKLNNIDIIVSLEAKGIPLAHALSVRLGTNYIVVRKSIKSYMENPIFTEVKSITTKEPQKIVLNGIDATLLKGKNVCIVDDVVSTGGSLKSLETLLAKTECNVVARVAVLLEEGGYAGEDLTYLDKLPVFPC
ncbi:MAG: adenine phosphoribosyltransferase [Synergistaceae bacterium]|nr:adenine phosphoribosyltransferase [Synergistaceae bacterium]